MVSKATRWKRLPSPSLPCQYSHSFHTCGLFFVAFVGEARFLRQTGRRMVAFVAEPQCLRQFGPRNVAFVAETQRLRRPRRHVVAFVWIGQHLRQSRGRTVASVAEPQRLRQFGPRNVAFVAKTQRLRQKLLVRVEPVGFGRQKERGTTERARHDRKRPGTQGMSGLPA